MAISSVAKVSQGVTLAVWDIYLTLFNLVTPSRAEGHVVPEGHPGAGGVWPEFIAPKEGDSRCCCPGLNIMANHGIIPRDGRNVSFKAVTKAILTTFNYSPTFCYFVPDFGAKMLKKDYQKDTFDLEEISLHNGIEHDCSYSRDDVHFQPDQSVPNERIIRTLLASATGKDKDGNPLLNAADISRWASKRRAEARVKNPEFSLSKTHRLFGSNNCTTLLWIFGGRVKDLETLLIEERIPNGWEPRIRKRKGITMIKFNKTVLQIEKGIDEKPFATEVPAVESSPAV